MWVYKEHKNLTARRPPALLNTALNINMFQHMSDLYTWYVFAQVLPVMFREIKETQKLS
jgi:hypothetical protein